MRNKFESDDEQRVKIVYKLRKAAHRLQTVCLSMTLCAFHQKTRLKIDSPIVKELVNAEKCKQTVNYSLDMCLLASDSHMCAQERE